MLGRSESARFRRAFNRADTARDGELTTADAARAYRGLGGTATEKEVIMRPGKLTAKYGDPLLNLVDSPGDQ